MLISMLHSFISMAKYFQSYLVVHTMFERATLSFGTTRLISKVALTAGSSQQGNARRASVDWKQEIQ